MESEKFDANAEPSIEALRRRVGIWDRSIEALFAKLIDAESRLEMARSGVSGLNAKKWGNEVILHKGNIATQLRIRNRLALQCGIPEREHTLEELKAAKEASAQE